MKKVIPIFIVITVLSLCACSNTAKNTDAETSSETEYVTQEGDTQIVGEVTAIVGNKVTLALGTVSGGGENRRNSGEGFTGEMPEDMSMPDGMNFQGREGFTGEMPDGEMPEMPSGGNGGGRPDMGSGEMPEDMSMPDGMERPSGNGGSSGGSVTLEKSGETADYTLPVGMTVSGTNGRSTDYSSVTVGTVLRLTIDTDGEVVAAEVL